VAAALVVGGCGLDSLFGDEEAIDIPDHENTVTDNPVTDNENPVTDNPVTDVDGDGQGDEEPTSLAMIDEDGLLQIVAGAEGSGANPENRTGAPPGFPLNGSCLPGAPGIAVTESAMGLVGTTTQWSVCVAQDLWDMRLIGPDDKIVARTWVESWWTFRLDLTEPEGTYRLEGRSRGGRTVSTSFVHRRPTRLVMRSVDQGEASRVVLTGYGSADQVDLVAYELITPGPFMEFAFVADLGPIPLDPSGVTTIPAVNQEPDADICLFVDVADEARFPNTRWACFEPPPPELAEPWLTNRNRSLADGLNLVKVIPAGEVVVPLTSGSQVSIASLLGPDGQPVGAIAAEGIWDGENFVNGEIIGIDDDPDLGVSFTRLCDAVAGAYKFSTDRCRAEPALRLAPYPLPKPLDPPRLFDPSLTLSPPQLTPDLIDPILTFDPNLIDPQLTPNLIDPALTLDPSLDQG
jgi:hypothetical protein